MRGVAHQTSQITLTRRQALQHLDTACDGFQDQENEQGTDGNKHQRVGKLPMEF